MINCPKCNGEYGYEDGNGYSCPECGHFWTDLCLEEEKIMDAVGNELQDGDDVTLVQDVKLGKQVLKRGTKAKSIRIIDPVDGHDLEGKIDGVGNLYLKSSIVKKL